MIDVFVPGIPKAQPRVKAYVRRDGKAGVYTPGSADAWRDAVVHYLTESGQLPSSPMTGGVCLSVCFWLPRPKRLMRRKDPDCAIHHTAKPDASNLLKLVEDVMTMLCVWGDDAQVSSVAVSKFYVEKGGTTGARIAATQAVERTD